MLWSFAINLFALRIVIFAFQQAVTPGEYEDFHEWTLLVILIVVLMHGAVFIWQAVGVFRAGESHIRRHGAIAAHWGAQFGVVVAFWLTASYSLSAWQMTIDVPDYVDYAEKWDQERESKYELLILTDNRVAINGSLELGITKRLSALLAENPSVTTVVLSSGGGNIFEARGLAKLFREKGINTLVENECSSACTTAFIGGKQRLLKNSARLGFHQYRVEADYTVLFADPAKAERRDRALYREAGVSETFIKRMHSAASADMWYPDTNELVEASVVTKLAD